MKRVHIVQYIIYSALYSTVDIYIVKRVHIVQYIIYSALYSTVDIYIVKRVHSTVYNIQCIIQYSGYIHSEEST